MSARCDRPTCSEPVAVEYRILLDRLIIWLGPVDDDSPLDVSGLCREHADSLRVPRGWSIDDEREAVPTLFQSVRQAESARRRRSSTRSRAVDGEQLELSPAATSGEETHDETATEEPESAPAHPTSPLPPLLDRAFHGTPMRS